MKNGDQLVDDIFIWGKLNGIYSAVLETINITTCIINNDTEQIRNRGEKIEQIKQLMNLHDGKNIIHDLTRIKTYFDIILYRKRAKISLWKDISAYKNFDANFAEAFLKLLKTSPEFSGKGAKEFEALINNLRQCDHRIYQHEFLINAVVDNFIKFGDLLEFQKYLLHEGKIDENNVFFVATRYFSPLKLFKERATTYTHIELIRRNGDVTDLYGTSPLIDSFIRVENKQINLYAFLITSNNFSTPGYPAQTKRLREKLVEAFSERVVYWLGNKSHKFKLWKRNNAKHP